MPSLDPINHVDLCTLKMLPTIYITTHQPFEIFRKTIETKSRDPHCHPHTSSSSFLASLSLTTTAASIQFKSFPTSFAHVLSGTSSYPSMLGFQMLNSIFCSHLWSNTFSISQMCSSTSSIALTLLWWDSNSTSMWSSTVLTCDCSLDGARINNVALVVVLREIWGNKVLLCFTHTVFTLLIVWQPLSPLRLRAGRLDGGALLLLPVVP